MYKKTKTNPCSAPDTEWKREQLKANQHSDGHAGKMVTISAGGLQPAPSDASDGASGGPSFSIAASASTSGECSFCPVQGTNIKA